MGNTPLNTGALRALRSKADRALGRRASAQERLADTTKKITSLTAEEVLLEQVSEVFRTLIDREICDGVQAVEKLLTDGLQAVFDDQNLSVTSEVETQRGKVSVELITTEKTPDGRVVQGVSSDAFGGAVTTVQSVLMRLCVLTRRGQRPLLLLDESLPAFDQEYVSNMGKFLRSLCTTLNVDILLVTHNPLLADYAEHSYILKKKDDVAIFNRVK